MRPATQKEYLDRIRDDEAENYYKKTGYVPTEWAVMNFIAGFDKGAEEMAKIKDEEWGKRVAELVTALSIYALTNESFPEYNDLALKALENFRKEVK